MSGTNPKYGGLNVLLMEKVHEDAAEAFRREGFTVIRHTALSPEELLVILPTIHVMGIRSKTKLPKEMLDAAVNLMAIGCFCIGTDTIDLTVAAGRGIPVFNSPYANSRSVAELVIAEMVMMSRQVRSRAASSPAHPPSPAAVPARDMVCTPLTPIPVLPPRPPPLALQAGDRSRECHSGVWNKKSIGCYEVRGKTLGIVGYGHVGSQLGVLAEMMGLTVLFYDIEPKLSLGLTRQVRRLQKRNQAPAKALPAACPPPRARLCARRLCSFVLSVLSRASLGKEAPTSDARAAVPWCPAPAGQVTSLDVLLAESDFVSLHVPKLASTANLMNADNISKMKPGGYLLNLSRGNVVDVDALAKALHSGALAGASVDVYPSEVG